MTNANSTTVKKSLPNQKPRRKSDPRKPKTRSKQKNAAPDTTQAMSTFPSSGDEVEIAINLFVSLIKKQPQVHEAVVWENFSNRLSEELRSKFEGHWYPDKPEKGSGYRCIRVNGSTPDSLVQRVADDCGIPCIHSVLPAELTLWIDPGEVSYRIGEDGSICRYYHFESEQPRSEVKKILTRSRSESADSQ
ncbi:protein BTG2-like [Rhopilema esculentum]|uniref:protein BTG2-like n=1 Tax=Rhopilema esculentum TaxID=499914 RepID=UPI0031D852EF|eukprot:gene5022-130_t